MTDIVPPFSVKNKGNGEVIVEKEKIKESMNYYIRKRDEYAEKINRNITTMGTVYDGLMQCNHRMIMLSDHAYLSVLFDKLSESNYNRFNVTRIDEIMEMFHTVQSTLQRKKEMAQDRINYWNRKLQESD